MIPAAFEYARPTSIDEALQAIAEGGDGGDRAAAVSNAQGVTSSEAPASSEGGAR